MKQTTTTTPPGAGAAEGSAATTTTPGGSGAAGSRPGNLSARELAKRLTQIPAAATEDGAKGTQGTSETATTTGALSENGGARDGLQGEEEGAETNTPPAEGGEGEGEQEGTEAAEAAPEPGADEAREAKAELPAELKDAMALAKGDGKKGVADLLKRVNKVVDQRDTERNGRLAAEERASRMEAEVRELRAAGANGNGNGNGPANGNGNGAETPEVARARREIGNVDHWLQWCEENGEGGSIPDGKGNQVELDARRVRQIQRDLQAQRSELVARRVAAEGEARATYGREYERAHATAVTSYPWLTDPKAPEQVELQNILRAFPSVKSAPDYELTLGDFFRGRAARQAEEAAKGRGRANGNGTGNGNGARKVPTPREPTRVLTEAPAGAVGGKKDAGAVAEEGFRRSGTTRDLAKTFSARARAGRA